MICECFYGYNWWVWCDIEVLLDENWYVFDFIVLCDFFCEIVEMFDYCVFFFESYWVIYVEVDGVEVEVCFEECCWVFFKEDCMIFFVENIIVEEIVWYIWY